jgi:protein-arginine kinase activator protein McsA
MQLPKGFALVPIHFLHQTNQLMHNLAKLNLMSQEAVRCQTCNASLAELKAIGKFGCPICYDTFKDELLPYLPQMQGGNNQHVGKRPKNGIESLNKEMQKAVKEERYEDAAKFRDRIKELQKTLNGSDLKAPDHGIKEDTV